MDITSRTIVVTGAAGGIGLATSEALLSNGARVFMVDLEPAATEAEGAEGIALDVTDPSAVERFVSDAGELDGLVNAAGVLQLGTIGDVTPDDWDRVVDVNLKGTFLMCRAVIPVLERRGGGSIVNVASISGRTKSIFSAPNYVASKGGVIGLTMVLAAQHAAKGVRVNAVAPGAIETPMTSIYTNEQWAAITEQIPMGRIGAASEVANVIVTLLSDQWSYVTGQTINVNGGQYM